MENMSDIIPSPVYARIEVVCSIGNVGVIRAVYVIVFTIIVRIGSAQLPTLAESLGGHKCQTVIATTAQVCKNIHGVEKRVQLVQVTVHEVARKAVGIQSVKVVVVTPVTIVTKNHPVLE